MKYTHSEMIPSDVLSHDSSNYNARIFLALSLLNLGKDNDSEGNYLQAIEQYPKQALAYQVRRHEAIPPETSSHFSRDLASFTNKRNNGTSLLSCCKHS